MQYQGGNFTLNNNADQCIQSSQQRSIDLDQCRYYQKDEKEYSLYLNLEKIQDEADSASVENELYPQNTFNKYNKLEHNLEFLSGKDH